jgi:hypothetical protein
MLYRRCLIKAKEFLCEFYDNGGLYNPADDHLTKSDYDDTRRPRLTLRHLNKMRKSKDMAKLDSAQRLDFLPTMYTKPSAE